MSIPIPIDTPAKYFNTFWLASREFWQGKWDSLLDIIGEDPFNLYVFGTMSIVFFTYWIIGGIYLIMDITNKPKFLRKYKIQPGTNEPVDPEKLKKVIWTVLFNLTVVSFPPAYIQFKLREFDGYQDIRTLPPFHVIIASFIFYLFVEEILFYYSHRLLHHKYIYKYIHKKHHEWTSPISITAVYCHPIEHIFSNILPLSIGAAILRSHIFTLWLWFALAIFNTLNDHSGYHLPFFSSSEAHDFHHLKFNNCYGVLGILDRLHGTDNMFRQTEAFKRHIMMLSFIPPRVAFPDKEEQKLKNN